MLRLGVISKLHGTVALRDESTLAELMLDSADLLQMLDTDFHEQLRVALRKIRAAEAKDHDERVREDRRIAKSERAQ